MQPRPQLKIANFKQFQVTYEINPDSTLNITICNVDRLLKYSHMKLRLQNINPKGFEMAMDHHKDFNVQFNEIDQKSQQKENKKYLQMKIMFISLFIRNQPQIINIPFKSNLSQIDFFTQKAFKMQQKIKKIQQKNQQKKTFFNYIEQKKFKSNYNQMYEYDQGGYGDQNYDMVQFFTLDLEGPGRYFIQISMLLNCTSSGYFYFYKDINYQTCFPSGALSLPITNHYIPLKFSFIHQCNDKNTFYTYDTYDYPFEAKNIIVTGKRLK